jgi:hypothetical protein
VKRLEAALDDTGAEIKESAMVFNFASQQEIEIDILITLNQGRRPLRVAVECRDGSSSGRPQGPSWIRDLRTKRDSCRLDKIVAVSSQGFTDPTKKEAATYGVELLVPEEISDESLRATLLPAGGICPQLTFLSDVKFGIVPFWPLTNPADVPRQSASILVGGMKSVPLEEIMKRLDGFIRQHFLPPKLTKVFTDEGFDETYEFRFFVPVSPNSRIVSNDGSRSIEMRAFTGEAKLRVITLPISKASVVKYGDNTVVDMTAKLPAGEMNITVARAGAPLPENPDGTAMPSQLHVDGQNPTVTMRRGIGIPLYIELPLLMDPSLP